MRDSPHHNQLDMIIRRAFLLAATLALAAFGFGRCAAETASSDAAERGYRLLTETPLLTSDFSQQEFDQIWKSWPRPVREVAERSTPQQRRTMAHGPLREGKRTVCKPCRRRSSALRIRAPVAFIRKDAKTRFCGTLFEVQPYFHQHLNS